MKFDVTLSAKLDEKDGTLRASIHGDLPDGVITAIGTLATAVSKALDQYTAKQAAKSLA